MTTIVEEMKEMYGENTAKFHIALLMEIHTKYGDDVATDFVNGNYENLPFAIV